MNKKPPCFFLRPKHAQVHHPAPALPPKIAVSISLIPTAPASPRSARRCNAHSRPLGRNALGFAIESALSKKNQTFFVTTV